MSTIKVSNIQNASTSSGGIAIDTSGHVTVDGVAYPSAGSLSGRNRIINGDMRIDQRNAGASVTATSSRAYVTDRWFCQEDTDGSMTVQQSTTAPAGFTNSLLVTVTGTDSSIGAAQFAKLEQRIEGYNVADFGFGAAGAQSVTLSFRVRSSVTGTYSGAIYNSPANRSYPFEYTISSANTWESKTVTIAGDTTGTWLTDNGIGISVVFPLALGSDYQGTGSQWNGAQDWGTSNQTNLLATNGATFYITGVQLEVGSVATPFERRSYGQELSLCQRYFQSINIFVSSAGYPHMFSVTKRSAPTVSSAAAGFTTSGTTPTVDGTWMNQSSGSAITVSVSSEL